jgi:phage terminase large subunit-like protein
MAATRKRVVKDERTERRDALLLRLHDLRESPGREPGKTKWDDLSGPEKLSIFKEFVGILLLEDRTTMVLHEYEERILLDYFSGCRETLVLIPKKNGKTTLIAALIVFHLFVQPDAYAVVAAASIKQAGTLYRQAVGFIKRSGLGERPKGQNAGGNFIIRPSTREIRTTYDEGLVQVLAADSDTADGVIPTLAIVDELHRHKSPDLYHVFRDGLGPRNGQIATISTAGDDELSALGAMRAKAIKAYREERPVHDEGYKVYRSPTGNFVMHEWSLEMTDDRDDMHVVKTVNPAPWHTLESLAERHDSPSTTTWSWARYACNVWYPLSDDPAIRPEEWDGNYDETAVIGPGEASLGIDFGWKNKSDCTAIVPYQWESENRQIVGEPVILEPAGDGSLLDDRAISEALLVFNGKTFDRDEFERDLVLDNDPVAVAAWCDAIEAAAFPVKIRTIVFDPNQGGQQLCQVLERDHKLPFTSFDQRVSALARADGQFLEGVRRHTIRQKWSTEARAHVMNAVSVPAAGGTFYFGRPKSGPRKPTDALRAASMVHSVTLVSDGKPMPDRARRKDSFSFS